MIAKYYRLSLADGDLGKDGKDESNSISNQRLLIEKYLASKDEFQEILSEEYVDDGYTGTNFDRPGFGRMMDDVRCGKIDTVIVKDMSRFGRDYIAVGDYLEQIFPAIGVRFIAVNNNYDSNMYMGTTMGFDMAIGNLVNSMYSKDISKKLITSNRSRWKKGYRTSGLPPFGYKQNPEIKGRYTPDPEAAEIVRHIFELAIKGQNCTQIASSLNDEKIPVPSEYYRERGVKGKSSFYTVEENPIWNYHRVRVILDNYEYTGALILGKWRTLITGSKINRNVPENEQIIHEGINEGIVSKEQFEQAQNVIRKTKKKEFRKEGNYLLKGKLRCGTCGRAMRVDHRYQDYKVSCSYGGKLKSQSGCNPQIYSMKTVEDVVQNSIYKYCQMLIELGGKIDNFTKLHAEQKAAQANTVKELTEQVGILRKERVRLYVNYADEAISLDAYKAKREVLDNRLFSLTEELEALNKDAAKNSEPIAPAVYKHIEEAKEIASDMEDRWTSSNNIVVDESKDEEQTEENRGQAKDAVLTRQMVEKMIESVYIYSDNRMEVRFRFEDEIKTITEKIS